MKKLNLKIMLTSATALTIPAACVLSNYCAIQTVLKNESTLLNNENSCFSGKINNRNVYYDIDSLCNQHDHNNNHPISGYYVDSKEKFSIDRNNFNYPLYIDCSVDSIPNDFLYNCNSFNQRLDMNNCSFTSIGDNFLRQCLCFCSDIELPLSLTSIGNYFLSYDNYNNCQIGFNKYLNLKNVKYIGNNFMSGNNNFNSNLDLHNVETIGKWFLAGCYSFGCNMTIPATCKSIGEGFMVDCRNFDSALTIESVDLKWEIGSNKTLCSNYGNNWKMCQSGFYVKTNNILSRNDILRNFKNSFPFKNGEYGLYRHYRIQPELNLLSISLKTKPNKTYFAAGEEFSSAGLVLTDHFDNNINVDIESGFTTNWDGKKFTSYDLGIQKVIVSYGNKTCEYEIYVTPPVITNIEIYHKPYKNYFIIFEETFECDGLSLKVNYSDGSFEIVTKGFETNYKEDTTFEYKDLGRKEVIVSYANKKCSYYINIIPSKVVDLRISSFSFQRKKFKAGEKFLSDGLVLLATYSSGSSNYVSVGFTTNFDDYVFKSSDAFQKYNVLVNYCGVSCSYEIWISEWNK